MKTKKSLKTIVIYVFAVCLILYSIFPFYWAINSSLKDPAGLFSTDLFPSNPQWKNYLDVFEQQPFGENIFNSVMVSSVTVLLSLGVAIFAAYALGRIEFRGRRLLLFTFLTVSMFPQIAMLSGLFELIRALGLYNNWLGLVFAYLIFTLPFSIWILTTFIRDIPRGLEEAAILEGAGPFTIVFKIFIPLMGPAFVTTGLLAFIAAWNEFLFALTFSLSDKARTVPVAIALMSGSSQHELPWANIMAASVVVTIPLVLLVFIFQRKIVSGLTAGALKG